MKEEKTKTEIKNIYILTRIDVGGGCIRFCDIVERCTNPAIIDYEKDIPISKINEINQKNCNSLIYKNNIDGLYPVFVGVDKNNNIRKIIIEANHESLDELVASKEVMHDQFFNILSLHCILFLVFHNPHTPSNRNLIAEIGLFNL